MKRIGFLTGRYAPLFLGTCLFFFLSSPLSCLKPGQIEDFLIRSWDIEDGLPQNSVSAVIQTRSGYIWFGTQVGLVRFDGTSNYKIFNRWNTRELKSDAVLCLYEDKRGTLWVGTDDGGIVGLDEGKWRAYTTAEGLSHNQVRVIREDSSGHLWIGTAYGLNRMKDGKFQVFTMDHGLLGNSITAVWPDRQGNIWVGTNGGGLNRLNRERFETLVYDQGITPQSITALLEDSAGTLWLGTEAGVCFLKDGKIKRLLTTGKPITDTVLALSEDRDKTLWVGTEGGGLYGSRNGVQTLLDTENGFFDDYIGAILEDREGSLWLGTYTGGLVQLQPARVKNIGRAEGLTSPVIYALVEDRQGFLWAGLRDSGLYRIEGTRAGKIALPGQGVAGISVSALVQAPDSSLWIGTPGQGLSRLLNGKWTRYTTTNGLAANTIRSLCLDAAGIVWIAGPTVLSRFNGRGFTHYSLPADVLARYREINLVCDSGQGFLWLGAKDGLLGFRDGRFFSSLPGTNGREFDQDIVSLHTDRRGRLWLGTRGSGLWWLDNGKLTQCTTEHGLTNDYICGILEDGQGHLWLSSYRGVFYVKTAELADFSQGKVPKIQAISFDEKDGLKSSVGTIGGQPAAYKRANGQLCFATEKGIAVFEPSKMGISDQPLPAIIQEVIADNHPLIGLDNPGLPPDSKVLEFNFTALSFRAPEKIKFQYRLEGFDREWVAAGPGRQRTALYLNLKPGAYRFRVRAAHDGGPFSPEEASFAFRIRRPLLENPLFYGLVVILLAALLGALAFIFRGKRSAVQEKYKTSALDRERVAEVLPRLVRLMEEEKVFLDGNLSLRKLAERLMIHPNYLSQIINEQLGSSFNDFINKYRIQEAQRRLLDPKESRKTVLDIAYDTGFYSKSVFNNAFKKFTGQTPSQFKKKPKCNAR